MQKWKSENARARKQKIYILILEDILNVEFYDFFSNTLHPLTSVYANKLIVRWNA